MKIRSIIILALAFLLKTGAYAQLYPVPVPATATRLLLENFDGTIDVKGYDGNKVFVSADDGLQPAEVAIKLNGSQLTIGLAVRSTKNRDFHLRIPFRLLLDIKGSCYLREIGVKNLQSEVNINACKVINVSNVSGPLVLSNSGGQVNVSKIKMTTANPISIITISGQINLQLPEHTAANLLMDTNSGSIFSDFDLPDRDPESHKLKAKHLEVKLGGGGVAITLQTLRGGIQLLKNKH